MVIDLFIVHSRQLESFCDTQAVRDETWRKFVSVFANENGWPISYL